MTPPTLPGEVWRGDIDGPVCVSNKALAWKWSHTLNQWYRSDEPDVYRAWALSLRAERDAAQRLAAAERAYRVAIDAHSNALDRDASAHVLVNLGARLDEAHAALIAAGGTP